MTELNILINYAIKEVNSKKVKLHIKSLTDVLSYIKYKNIYLLKEAELNSQYLPEKNYYIHIIEQLEIIIKNEKYIPSQKDIDDYINSIIRSLYTENDYVDNYVEFLLKNYKILKYKKHNTKEEQILMNGISDSFRYTAPEILLFNVRLVAFFMALENYNIPHDEW